MIRSQRGYLGVDLGASSGRAVLGVLQDHRLKIEEISRFPNAPCQLAGRWSWDFPALWNNIRASMRWCAKQGHRRLSGVAVDTWGVDFGLLGADGRLLANPTCYRNPRTNGVKRRIGSGIRQEKLFQLTGMPLNRISTLSQLVALANSPDAGTLKSAKSLLMMPDLFRYFLCGHKGVELTSAGTSQLINPRNSRWCAKVFQTLHLPRRIVPELIETATVVGRLSQELADEAGLNRVPVVAVAGHDTASAIAAAPWAGEDAAVISCGTWVVVGTVEERPITTVEALRRGFINELGLESVLFVKGMTGLYLFERLYRALRQTDRRLTYTQLIREALEAKPLSRFLNVNWPPFFAVDDTASSARDWLRLTGQKTLRSRGTLVRTLLEGLAWSCRAAVQDIGTLTGRILRRISLVGGGVRNTMLCQMIADATGLEVTAGPAEATVIGNLAMQALAAKQLRNVAEMRTLIQNSFNLKTYRPKATERWDIHAPAYYEIVAKGTK